MYFVAVSISMLVSCLLVFLWSVMRSLTGLLMQSRVSLGGFASVVIGLALILSEMRRLASIAHPIRSWREEDGSLSQCWFFVNVVLARTKNPFRAGWGAFGSSGCRGHFEQ